MSRMIRDKKGVITLYIFWFIIAVIILIIGSVLAPAGVMFNEQLYEVGESLMLDANESMNNINDTTVRSSVQRTIGTALDNQEGMITLNSTIFRYSWLIFLVLGILVIFIATRRAVEYGGGFV